MCESMLQDSGTPSLPSPLSASVCEPEPLPASLEEPLGPKANEPWTRPPWKYPRCQSAWGWGGADISLTKRYMGSKGLKGGYYLE